MNPTIKKFALYVAVPLSLLTIAFAAGRYSLPAKTVEVEKKVVVEKVVEKIDEKKLAELIEEIRFFKTQLSELKKTIHREKRTLEHPNGLKEITEVEDINISKVVKEQEVQFVDREVKVQETRYIDRVVEVKVEVEKTKIVEAAKPQWKLTPMVGVNLPSVVSGNPAFVFGGAVERRIVGPVHGGVWGLSNGTAGISLSLEF